MAEKELCAMEWILSFRAWKVMPDMLLVLGRNTESVPTSLDHVKAVSLRAVLAERLDLLDQMRTMAAEAATRMRPNAGATLKDFPIR